MGVVEFELTRTVHAPIEDVFARLADITRYDDWMPRQGSILRRTEVTSSGPPQLGTTYLDTTSFGATPGEIVEFEAPHTIVFHWWDTTKAGKTKAEGWPGYSLTGTGPDTTLVLHRARLRTAGTYRLATPVLARIARRERAATLQALATSFEPR
ncbi:hypothetical protein JNB_13138 [Janibacter sp. HTCC2649]|uniref:SRPBCC family protein n=1 Tax=Janibacter sp. HTCC2649 TaxID=313589 RepID=UPI00006719C4|nr:SRPBCC family protein [Janibacter sp. HTCC2649]EAP97910.1 hypothetical protein JNB_13138 [Janibacter sp. HTCC2649]